MKPTMKVKIVTEATTHTHTNKNPTNKQRNPNKRTKNLRNFKFTKFQRKNKIGM